MGWRRWNRSEVRARKREKEDGKAYALLEQ